MWIELRGLGTQTNSELLWTRWWNFF